MSIVKNKERKNFFDMIIQFMKENLVKIILMDLDLIDDLMEENMKDNEEIIKWMGKED